MPLRMCSLITHVPLFLSSQQFANFPNEQGHSPANSRTQASSRLNGHGHKRCGMRLPGKNKPEFENYMEMGTVIHRHNQEQTSGAHTTCLPG